MAPGDPLFDLSGRVALVTGGSRGLGYQMVRTFAEHGADVIVASRKLDNCEKVAEEMRAMGRRALAVSVHAARWDSLDSLVETAYEWAGHVDILVNNAGMGPAVPSHEVTEQLFDSVVGLNFKGPFRLASQIAKRMYDRDGGSIINVSSSGSLRQRQGGAQCHDQVSGGRVRAQGAGEHHLSRAFSHGHLEGVDG